VLIRGYRTESMFRTLVAVISGPAAIRDIVRPSEGAGAVRREQWRDLLVPTEPLQVSRPRGLRQRTYEQLVDEYNRLLAAIADLSDPVAMAAHPEGL
jgi:hypothetical protein